MVTRSEDKKDQARQCGKHASSECGSTHDDCPNTWKGSCDREAGHSGSHHCDKCQSAF